MKSKASFLMMLTVFVASTLLAQRGHNNGFAGPGRTVAQPPTPNLGGRPYPIRRDLPTPTGLIAPAASYTGISPGALRSIPGSGIRGGSRGFTGGGYVGYYGAPFLPYLDTGVYSSFPSYSEQAEATSAQINVQMQDNVARQMEQMSSEIRQLREAQFQNGTPIPGQPDWVAPPAAFRSSAATEQPLPPQPPIVLVLQNGSKVTVNNYAVMNGTIWDFSKSPARKISIASLNLGASEKATEESGGEFPQLTSSRK